MTELADNLEGFRIILNDFVETFLERLPANQADKLLADIQSDPFGWFDAWSEHLHLNANTTIYAVSAKKLLQDYAKQQIIRAYASRLPAGAAQLPAGAQDGD